MEEEGRDDRLEPAGVHAAVVEDVVEDLSHHDQAAEQGVPFDLGVVRFGAHAARRRRQPARAKDLCVLEVLKGEQGRVEGDPDLVEDVAREALFRVGCFRLRHLSLLRRAELLLELVAERPDPPLRLLLGPVDRLDGDREEEEVEHVADPVVGVGGGEDRGQDDEGEAAEDVGEAVHAQTEDGDAGQRDGRVQDAAEVLGAARVWVAEVAAELDVADEDEDPGPGRDPEVDLVKEGVRARPVVDDGQGQKDREAEPDGEEAGDDDVVIRLGSKRASQGAEDDLSSQKSDVRTLHGRACWERRT